jgi:type IV pilus assembly protein PilM
MFQATKTKAVVGLDIEAGSVAASEVSVNGETTLTRHGVLPIEPGVFREGEVADPDALGAAIKQLFAENKLGRNVRVGVANQRVAVRSMRLPKIEDRAELETAIRFQAQDHIPMPLEQAVLDWQVVGEAVGPGGEPQIEVVAVAGRRDMLSGMVAAIRKAGLRPVGIDHSAFGMIRALAGDTHSAVGAGTFVEAPAQGVPSYEERISSGFTDVAVTPTPSTAKLYCNLGDVTNLAVARGSACLFTRISPFGMEGIAQKLAERRELTLEHARQWLVHTGLEAPVEAIEGDAKTVAAARDALAEGAAKLADELRLSLEYYAAQEGALPIEGVVACGPGTTVPGLLERLQRDVGQRFESGRPHALAHLDDGMAARLTLSYGLALEE